MPYLLASVFVEFLHVAPLQSHGTATPGAPVFTTARPMPTAVGPNECPACDWLRVSAGRAAGTGVWIACDDVPGAAAARPVDSHARPVSAPTEFRGPPPALLA